MGQAGHSILVPSPHYERFLPGRLGHVILEHCRDFLEVYSSVNFLVLVEYPTRGEDTMRDCSTNDVPLQTINYVRQKMQNKRDTVSA